MPLTCGFTVSARARATVTDLEALVAHVDRLVARTDHLHRLEGDTFWDGWEDRDGSGFQSVDDAVWLDDDPRAMLDLALFLIHLEAADEGVDLEVSVEVDDAVRPTRRALGAGPTHPVTLTVEELAVTDKRRAGRWLGTVDRSRTVLGARAAVKLLRSIDGVSVTITAVTATPVRPPRRVRRPRIEVRDGGSTEPVDIEVLCDPRSRWESDPSTRRPVRLDGPSVKAFLGLLHWIPSSKGFTSGWVLLHVPGWTSNDLSGAFLEAGIAVRRGSGTPALAEGVSLVDLAPSGRCTRIDFDPDLLFGA